VEYLTIKEAAKALEVSPDTIRRRIKQGKMKAEKRPTPYGEAYFIADSELSPAIEVVTIARPQDTELLELVKQLHAELQELRQEVAQLKEQQTLLLQEPKKRPWWKLFGS